MIKLNNTEIRVVFTDIDGVWTDGGMFYNQDGEAFKKFNTSDSAGVLFLKKLGVRLVVLTGENSAAVKSRMKKLNIQSVFYGAHNKLQTAENFCRDHQINLKKEAAFIGNDFNDYRLLKSVAHSAVPSDAPSYIQKLAHIVVRQKGGEGAFRAYVEYLIQQDRDLSRFIEEEFAK